MLEIMKILTQGNNPWVAIAVGILGYVGLRLHMAAAKEQKSQYELQKMKDDAGTSALVDALKTSKEGLQDAKAKFDADLAADGKSRPPTDN